MAPTPGLKMIGPAMGFQSEVFEIDSKKVGLRFEIAVTFPPGYSAKSKAYPVLYATDVHTNMAAMLAATAQVLTNAQLSIEPYILVCIGYADMDTKTVTQRRARELTPPGEPVPEVMKAHVTHPRYGFGDEDIRRHMESAQNGRADLFQAFVEHELHPEIVRRYSPVADKAGFFGHSNGGLFALHVLLSQSALFDRLGAASPAILTADSKVFQAYTALAEQQDVRLDVDLFLSLAEYEFTGEFPLYRSLGLGAVRFIDLVKTSPIPGLTLATSVIAGENHASVVFEAFKRFVLHSYGRRT